MEEFSIALGAELNINSIKEQIKNASANLSPLEIRVDTKKAQDKLNSLTNQISKLNNEFKVIDNMSSLTTNLTTINNSLKSIAKIVESINKVDGFNNLANGLNNLSPIAETLKTELSSIKTAMESFKGVNLNIGISSGNSKTMYDNTKRMAVAELREQETALEEVYRKYTNTAQGFIGVTKALSGTNFAPKLWNFKDAADDSTASLENQMIALQRYINLMQEGARLKGIDISSATSTFSKSANEIIADVNKIGTGKQSLENNMNQLKGLFGSGIDAEALTKQLNEIKISIDNVSSAIANIKFDNATLELFTNTIKSLNSEIQNLSSSISGLNNKPIINNATGITNVTQQINNANTAAKNFNQTINSTNPIGKDFINLSVISEFEKKVKGIISNEEQLKTVTREHFQQFGNVTTKTFSDATNKITNFVVTIKNAKNEVESLKYSYNKDVDRYVYTGSSGNDNYAKTVADESKQIDKNNAAITNYTATLQRLKAEYQDINANKPIKNTDNLKTLNSLYDTAIEKVNALSTATKSNYASTEAIAKAEISNLETKIKLYREEEYAANQLRAKPIETLKGEQVELFRKFKAEIESSGIALDKFKSVNISNLSSKVNGISDKQSLMEYLNLMSVAQAEFKALQAEQKVSQQQQKAETDKVNAGYKELLSVIKQIESIQVKITGLDDNKNASQISSLSTQLSELQKKYLTLKETFGSKLSAGQTQELNTALQTVVDKMNVVNAKIEDTKRNLKIDIKTNITNGSLENQIATIENNYRQLGKSEDEVISKTKTLRTLLSQMDASDDIESVTSDYLKFNEELITVQNSVKALQAEQKRYKDETNLANKKIALSGSIDILLKSNSAAAAEFGARLQQIKSEIASADGVKLTNLKAEFQDIKRQAELAGKATMTLGDKLKSKLGSLATYFSASMMISYTIRGIRSMFDNVLSVNTAMTELYRVTNLTESQYSQLYDKMVSGAKKYNAALNDVISSTAEWVRFGFDDTNVAEQLAELTVMYQHVTDLDHSLATENLLTAYKGFKPTLDVQFNGDAVAAVEHIMDIYDKLGGHIFAYKKLYRLKA